MTGFHFLISRIFNLVNYYKYSVIYYTFSCNKICNLLHYFCKLLQICVISERLFYFLFVLLLLCCISFQILSNCEGNSPACQTQKYIRNSLLIHLLVIYQISLSQKADILAIRYGWPKEYFYYQIHSHTSYTDVSFSNVDLRRFNFHR